MKPRILVLSLLVISCGLLAATTSRAVAGDAWRLARTAKQRERQVQAVRRQLGQAYGNDAWYVFQVAGPAPRVTQSIVRVTNGFWHRNFAAVTVTSQLETRVHKVHGSAAAAKLIWEANNSPVRFVFRTFVDERAADEFYSSIKY